MSNGNTLKVIIVGGGPVGLTAAHALTQAGIPFTLLEQRRSAIIEEGSNLVLLPSGMRALGQLGLLPQLKEVSSELGATKRLDHSGRDMGDFDTTKWEKKYFSTLPHVLSRHDLTRVMYENLPQSSRNNIIPKKRVSGIQTTAEGVEVSCTDGTVYMGSFVIGADGAHSMVRSIMRKLAITSGSPEVNEEQPFRTTYRCIWMRFMLNASPLLHEGLVAETHGVGAATQLFAGKETAALAVYERLRAPTKERIRFTAADEDAIINRWKHLPLLKGRGDVKDFTLNDANMSRLNSGIVSLEEGEVQNWSYDSRIVLVGDAAKKMTPSTGSGCNNGIIDVVTLANELYKITRASDSSAQGQIRQAFKAYQDVRFDAVVDVCQETSEMTAMATWGSSMHKFLDRYVMGRAMVQWYLAAQGSTKVAATPRFDFVAAEEAFEGAVKWVQPMPTALQA